MRLKLNLFSILIFAFIFSVKAQSLPNKQENNLQLPTTFKVDGKSIEWGNIFQAYNRATNIYYSIANNKNVIYLIIQAKEMDIVKRIIGGGVVFTIDKSGTKSSKNNAAITFPVLSDGDKIAISTPFNELKAQSGDADSLLRVLNKNLTGLPKEIGVNGMIGLPDSSISVYNDDGIKVAMLFDSKGVLTYELAISLKLLGMSASDPAKFSYNVRINGISSSRKPITVQTSNGAATVTTTLRALSTGNSNFDFMHTPTDFWGEYVLTVRK